MKIFAMGDLHLSLGETVDKPMDMFGSIWADHTERLYENWKNLVSNQDVVILCGDLSWGLRLEEAMADLNWIHHLPGKKILFKGNHDLWWQSAGKLNQLYEDGSMAFMQNHCYIIEEESGRRIAVCGSRGWSCPGVDGFTEHDEKIYERELLRLQFSLEEGKASGADVLLGALHYPPTNDKMQPSGFTRLMSQYGVKTCVYGHLHGKDGFKRGLQGVYNGVAYHLVSLDYLEGIPKEVLV
ncbi:MAG: serine/threonine protein phosphatase [Firmicutes bacterium]|nr:serine/threonine protein phosphatase [Bacillota bacterium]